MRYLSVCSGIEAASVAFKPLGWEPLAFSEIEPFPRAVLQHHYPDIPLHGDFTELKEQPWIVDADMLCGGTPCQSFSVAGLRRSLDDDRGNLTLQFALLADAIDNLRSTAGREPAWILWENVPGVLNTSDNAFGAFLGGLCGRDEPIPEPANGWPSAGVVDGPTRVAAWRVLDAKHFGLAQRRKRVFVLAKGGAGRWAAADALLPIIESSRWHPAPSRGKGEGVAASTGQGTEGGCYRWQNDDAGIVADDVAASLRAKGTTTDERSVGSYVMAHGQANAEVVSDGEPSLTCNHEAPIAFVQNQREEVREQDVAGALSAEPGTHQTTYVAFDPAQVTSKTNRSNPQPGDPCHTLHSHEPPMLVRMREGKEGGGKGPLVSEDQSLTLATANDQVLAFAADTVTSKWAKGAEALQQGAQTGGNCIPVGMQVRRLTPLEAERLQGFPDGYTDVPWNGKQATDGHRYRALGNSWAVPCVRYIGERIVDVEK